MHQLHDCEQGCDNPMSILQMRTAMTVMRHQPLSLGELATQLNMSNPSASALVDRMVEHRILHREPDPKDRRKIAVSIHPDSEEKFRSLFENLQHAFLRIADRLGDENVEQWFQVMTQINALLDEEQHHETV